MSGVAKDDTSTSSPTEDSVSAAGAPDTATPDGARGEQQTAAPTVSSKDEADSKPRRTAAHLRVVTDNDAEFVPPVLPAQRIGDAIRTARENAGYSLEQVSRETRVHLSHLRAIEDMTPGLLGAPVYAKGYIKSYARFLGMDEQSTLDRFLSECAAILKDPEKPEIAAPASSKSRKLPVAVPVLGILVVGLVAAGGIVFLTSGDKPPPAEVGSTAEAAAAAAAAEVVVPQLRIVALKRGMLEVRSAKGDKYVHRYYAPGEFFVVRVGAGFTVSADDGSAFEWRLGDQSLGLMAASGPVYTQSVDLAAQRQPIVTEPVAPPVVDADTPLSAAPAPGAARNRSGDPASPGSARPRATSPATPPAAQSATPPAADTPAAPPVRDPALDAYPDLAPAAPGQ